MKTTTRSSHSLLGLASSERKNGDLPGPSHARKTTGGPILFWIGLRAVADLSEDLVFAGTIQHGNTIAAALLKTFPNGRKSTDDQELLILMAFRQQHLGACAAGAWDRLTSACHAIYCVWWLAIGLSAVSAVCLCVCLVGPAGLLASLALIVVGCSYITSPCWARAGACIAPRAGGSFLPSFLYKAMKGVPVSCWLQCNRISSWYTKLYTIWYPNDKL